MSYTLRQLKNAAELAMGGKGKVPDGADLNLIVTEAVERLVGYAAWNWRVRSTTLSLVQDQAYVALPADFGGLLAVDGNATNRYHLAEASMPEILRMRAEEPSNHVTSTGELFRYALTTQTQATTTALPLWRMELYPAPTASEADALSLTYRIQLGLPAADADAVNCPAQCNAALLACVRAAAASAVVDGTIPSVNRQQTFEAAAQRELAALRERDALLSTGGRLVGTTELIRNADAAPGGRFYTETPITIT